MGATLVSAHIEFELHAHLILEINFGEELWRFWREPERFFIVIIDSDLGVNNKTTYSKA